MLKKKLNLRGQYIIQKKIIKHNNLILEDKIKKTN
jgi:hypothetical protein